MKQRIWLNFTLGSVSIPRTPSIRVFEYCAKNSIRLYKKSYFLTVLNKLINFRTLATRTAGMFSAVRVASVRLLAPFLKFPTICVYDTFKCYGITESLCLCLSCKPKYSVHNLEYLIRVSRFSRAISIKGTATNLLNNATNNKKQIVAYFKYLNAVWNVLANTVSHSYNLTTELARIKLTVSQLNSSLLCSGDCGIYSVLSLVLQYITVTSCCRLIATPNVSSMQYANVILGSLLSLNSGIMSFSNIFDWVSSKHFVLLCFISGAACAIYNPKARYRQRLLAYAANCGVANCVRCVLTAGNQLRTRFESVNTTFLSSISLTTVNMLTVVFVCINLILLIKYKNALKCIS